MSKPLTNFESSQSKAKEDDPSQARHLARCCLVQSIYQWQMSAETYEHILAEQQGLSSYRSIDGRYFKKVLKGLLSSIEAIDALIKPHLDRKISELNPVELAIIRMATYELTHCPKVPSKVVINEALDITKAFGAEQGYKYVNAILDAVLLEKTRSA